MNHCEFTEQARSDLRSIHDYIARDSPPAALRIVQQIEEMCYNIAANPFMGRSREELSPDLRSFPVRRYLIFYRPLREGVQIIRVSRGERNLESILEE